MDERRLPGGNPARPPREDELGGCCLTWHGTEIVGEKRANALHGIDLDAFTLPRPHCLFVCGVFVTHYKDKINKVMWAFAGDALTDAYLEQAALVVDYRQGVGIGEAHGDQSMPVNPGDSLYTVLFSTLMPHLFASRSGRLQANHRSRCAKLRGCEILLCIPLTFRRRHDKLTCQFVRRRKVLRWLCAIKTSGNC